MIYASTRKEKSDMYCLPPTLNYITPQNLYKLHPGILNKGVMKFDLYLVRVKKPTRVVIKAPFHYKVGKHRLTLCEFIYKKDINLPILFGKKPQSLPTILLEIPKVLDGLPIGTGPILQTKSTKAKVPFLLDKTFFNF